MLPKLMAYLYLRLTIQIIFFRRKDFVFNNLAIYSVLFQKYILRSLRSDLTCTKEAHLLMRVAKVMNQPGLMNIIDEGEPNKFP